jgi:4-hydroxythreonine-4-phosphate dehydrogenase
MIEITTVANTPLAITMGDACGIGPEIIAALFRMAANDTPGTAGGRGCVVLGDVAVMRRAAQVTGGFLAVAQIDDVAEWHLVPPQCIAVLQVPGLPADLLQAPVGCVDARAGAAAAACIKHAVALALKGEVSAVVTAPIHKEAFAAAGVGYPGHTEMLQALCAEAGEIARKGAGKPPDVRMMLANDELRTVLVTIHMSLRHAIEAVTFDAVLQTIRMAHQFAHCSAASWGPKAVPRIAVAGLNPHAGEGGLFGDEELRIIGPAVRGAQAEGINAQGPFAPDTVFMRARHTADHPGEFDVVVAMTHDHGLIPVKYLGLAHGVNVTLGLPLIRTSPDHGVAFDIAGKGVADASSLQAAVRMARERVRAGLDNR